MSPETYAPIVPSAPIALPSTTYAANAKNGVAMNVPPVDLLPSIMASIEQACATIPPGKKVALVAVVDMSGANLALVSRIKGNITVKAWAGKKWGEPIDGGAQVLVTW